MEEYVYRGRERHAEKVNAYINSRHPQPTVSVLPSAEEPVDPNHQSVHPEWKAALDQYHMELDRLREDWALEVMGRFMQQATYFKQIGNPHATDRALQTLSSCVPKDLFVLVHRKAVKLQRYWDFSVKRRIWPRWWKPLQRHYQTRKFYIDKKYSDLIGIKVSKPPVE